MTEDLKLNMDAFLPLRDVVFNTLREAILKGDLKPGERLMELQLAAQLGVSRTPIREAIRMLEQEGLARHLKWGQEEDFWRFEYNFRSSVASAIHMRARVACGIAGAGKREEDLTPEEELHVIRHTAAHICAQAIKRLYPQADFAFGPATEKGFFYDVDLGEVGALVRSISLFAVLVYELVGPMLTNFFNTSS